MNRKTILMLSIATAFSAIAPIASADPLQPADGQVIAREAAEGPRGADNERPGDRHRRGGRLFEDVSAGV
jgi:hypothetical protein